MNPDLLAAANQMVNQLLCWSMFVNVILEEQPPPHTHTYIYIRSYHILIWSAGPSVGFIKSSLRLRWVLSFIPVWFSAEGQRRWWPQGYICKRKEKILEFTSAWNNFQNLTGKRINLLHTNSTLSSFLFLYLLINNCSDTLIIKMSFHFADRWGEDGNVTAAVDLRLFRPSASLQQLSLPLLLLSSFHSNFPVSLDMETAADEWAVPCTAGAMYQNMNGWTLLLGASQTWKVLYIADPWTDDV